MNSHNPVLCRLGAVFVFAFLLAAGASQADAATFTPVTLQNGWMNVGQRNAGVSLVSGIVQFVGEITAGSGVAFTLPVGFRPSTNVYVPTACNGGMGRLFIQSDGTVTVQTTATCATGLEGASFALPSAGFTSLTLQNGWTNAPFGTSSAAVELINGVVHFRGAIAGGTSPVAFTLPAGFAPATMVYVPVDMCSATNGRLVISPSGTVSVQAESSFANAQCFTSLDGASFALNASGFTELALQTGWTDAPFGTSNAAARDLDGIVHLKGAIASGSGSPFTLPVGLRPASVIVVPVDMCNATSGMLIMIPDGTVGVQAQSSFSNAQCFTSLDGVSFATAAFTPLALQNGWTAAPFSTTIPASTVIDGILYFKGAIANGSGSPFTLPIEQRPTVDVYVPVDLCGAAKGRLMISSSTGVVTVQAKNGASSSAQCFTSLEGASFVLSEGGTLEQATTLTLQNGWTSGPFNTGSATIENIGGIVHFAGAIANGTGSPFTLPAGFAPAQDVYIAVDLCGAANGRLVISGGTGVVSVQAENGTFSNAQCFTSLDGASYVLSQGSSTALGLLNGWSGAPFATRPAATVDLSGTIHLSGAIATGGTNPIAFTLPAAFAPATDVYVPVDLCSTTKGRLVISGGSGTVSVQAENGTFSNAQCFTSLDGAFYSP